MNAPRALHRVIVWLTLILSTGCTLPATAPAATSPARTTAHPRVLVIDTDMAADDWLAILYVLQRSDVTLAAITVTGAGEAQCAPGVQHALGLVTLAGDARVPVACGRETPLRGEHVFPGGWRDRVDSLLGLPLPDGPETVSNQTAVELLATTIQASPDTVTLLTLGPLTNVAEALQADPSLAEQIDGIYVMGGAVNVPGNVGASGVGIDNPVAEWNVYVDPYAANIVLQSGVPITLVPLGATNHVPLTRTFYDNLKSNHASPEATFVYDVLTEQRAFIDSGGYSFWDPLAAAIVTDDSLATFRTETICVVETEGPESGWTKAGPGCPDVRVAISADGKRFEQVFVETLNSPSP